MMRSQDCLALAQSHFCEVEQDVYLFLCCLSSHSIFHPLQGSSWEVWMCWREESGRWGQPPLSHDMVAATQLQPSATGHAGYVWPSGISKSLTEFQHTGFMLHGDSYGEIPSNTYITWQNNTMLWLSPGWYIACDIYIQGPRENDAALSVWLVFIYLTKAAHL